MALTFSQVADILMLANNIPEERRGTFVSRLKQWQKMGFPTGVKGVGRGVKVSYGADQLYQLALHMRLLVLGLTPERAQRMICSAWDRLADAIVVTALRRANEEGDYLYLLFQYDALTELKDPAADHDHVFVFVAHDHWIVDTLGGVENLPKETRELRYGESFEQLQLVVRNMMVNTVVLEIDSIVSRIWMAMTKLGIPADTLQDDMQAWLKGMLGREKENEKSDKPIKFNLIDNLKDVELSTKAFAEEALGLKMSDVIEALGRAT